MASIETWRVLAWDLRSPVGMADPRATVIQRRAHEKVQYHLRPLLQLRGSSLLPGSKSTMIRPLAFSASTAWSWRVWVSEWLLPEMAPWRSTVSSRRVSSCCAVKMGGRAASASIGSIMLSGVVVAVVVECV